MALLLGVTNLPWMVLLSLLVFLEKVTSVGRQIATVGGAVLVAAGAWLLLTGTP
jgi:predicted metal-binding membrane protein